MQFHTFFNLKPMVLATALGVFSISTLAMAKSESEIRVAQKLAQEYTGQKDYNVDGRLGSALAGIIGCQLGEFLKKDGLKAAAEILEVQMGKAGAPEAISKKVTELVQSKLQDQTSKIDEYLEKSCNEEDFVKKYDGPSGLIDKGRAYIGVGPEDKENVKVAHIIAVSLEPQIKASKEHLVQGDLRAVGATLFGEGSRIFNTLKNIGQVDFESAEARQFVIEVSKFSNSDLILAVGGLRGEAEEKCDPHHLYETRKALKQIKNVASNLLELPFSPLETLVEILVEILLKGDSNSMARLFQINTVAYSKIDENQYEESDVKERFHDHLQHKEQSDACYDAEKILEISLREARGRFINQKSGKSIAPLDFDGKNNQEALISPEKFLK